MLPIPLQQFKDLPPNKKYLEMVGGVLNRSPCRIRLSFSAKVLARFQLGRDEDEMMPAPDGAKSS